MHAICGYPFYDGLAYRYYRPWCQRDHVWCSLGANPSRPLRPEAWHREEFRLPAYGTRGSEPASLVHILWESDLCSRAHHCILDEIDRCVPSTTYRNLDSGVLKDKLNPNSPVVTFQGWDGLTSNPASTPPPLNPHLGAIPLSHQSSVSTRELPPAHRRPLHVRGQ